MPDINKRLCDSISKYGRSQFAEDLPCSVSMVNSLFIGTRKLGVLGFPSMAEKAANLLGEPMSVIRPDVYK